MLLGLRGVGKTVLLNRIFNLAEERVYLTIRIAAPEGGELANRAFPDPKPILLRLSAQHNLRDKLRLAGAAMRNFAAMFKLSHEGFDFGASPAESIADSGSLERDFAEVRGVTVHRGTVWAFLRGLGLTHKKDLRAYRDLWKTAGQVCKRFTQGECMNPFIAAGYKPN